jgi:NitT/TauT family transport system permease protein
LNRGAYSSATLIGFASVVAGIVLWQLSYEALERTSLFRAYSINLFFASPIQVLQSFGELARSGELLVNCYFSFVEFLYGFLLAIAVGIPLGVLMATMRKVNNFLDPWVSTIYATPRVALAPIIMVWFGLGFFSKALVVFLGAVFPILLNTYTGIQSVKPNLIELVRAFGGSRVQLFFKVMLPDAIPAIMTGLKLAVGRAVIGVVVAEWFGAEAGIGYMVYLNAQLFQPGPVFVGIIVLVIFGHVSFICLEWLQNWISPWYRFQLQQREAAGAEME